MDAVRRAVINGLALAGLHPGTRVLAAVSGGLDSVCLLYALCAVRPWTGVRVTVGHVEHGLRGDASLRDACFVSSLAHGLFCPVMTAHVDVLSKAKRSSVSVETAARTLRYQALREMAARCGASVILTAHHADDQLETILMHLCRGSGLAGLCGIAPFHDGLLRPFLSLTREQLSAYARACGLMHVEDETNAELAYHRNRMRQTVVPALRAYEPGVARQASRAAALLRRDLDALDTLAASALTPSLTQLPNGGRLLLSALSGLPDAVTVRVLRLLSERCLCLNLSGDDSEMLFTLVRSACDGERRNLPGRAYADICGAYLYLTRESPPPPAARLSAGGQCGAWRIFAADTPSGTVSQPFPPALAADWTVRVRAPGDWMRPFGLSGRKSVSDILTDEKIPPPLRSLLPIVYSGSEALWIPGVRVSERLRVLDFSAGVRYLCLAGHMPWIDYEREDAANGHECRAVPGSRGDAVQSGENRGGGEAARPSD